MPGNELGDRVHNFFAEDNSLQGQNHSQVAEGNWPVLNSNFWAGSQRQADLLNSNNRNFNSQNSDLDRGEASYPFHVSHGLNFSQSNLRPDFAKSQPLNEQLHLNGFMYGNQFIQTRQSEANFLAVDTDPDQRHSITSRGLSVRESQQGNGPDYQAKASFRTETSVSPVSFDLFGGQQQMSHQQSSIPQSLQRQQSGFNDMQHLQQQLVIRKMQELQRHQQPQQSDLRQQNLINQVPPFAKQTPGSQSTLVNGTPNSDTLLYAWTAEPGARWLNRGSPTIQQGSPSGLGFPPNHGQTQRSVDLVPQQVDQSLYGVPISSSRGLNQYSQMVADRYMPQTSGNFLQSSQQNLLPEQAGAQDDPSISRHKFQNDNLFGLASRQPLSTDTRNMGGLQQVSFMSRTAPQQDFLGRQELAVQQETSHEQPVRQVVSRQNEAALDPTEEKILFGSDDNIWAAFGKSPNMSGEVGNPVDNDGLSNGFPSIQSGSWSALMQSAVAETSSSDVAPQEEWSSLMFHNNDGPSGSQASSMHNDGCRQETSLANDKIRMPSALSSGPFPPPDDTNTNYVMGSNLKFQNDPGQRPQTEMYQRFLQSSEGAGNWSNSGPIQKSVAQGSQMYRDVSQHPLQSERNARMNSPPWVPGQIGTRLQSNGGNAQAAISPGGDRVMNTHEAEKSQQHSQNSQARVMQGEVVHGSSLWKSNSIPSSATELGHVKSRGGNPQAHQGVLSLNDTTSVAKSCNVGISDGTSPFLQNNYLLNQWKDAQPPARSQGRESVGRPLNQANESNQVSDSMNSCGKDEVSRHEMENCDGKENSNDSHRSNLSQHTSSAFREGGLSDVSDSRSLPTGNQKSMNQLSRKISASRKFQYHPMGNVNEDVEPPYGLKQPKRVQDMPQQNARFVQAKVFGHVPRNSTVMEKVQSSELQTDGKGSNEESPGPGGSCSGHAANTSIPFARPIDTYTSSSQNMLELLHKVDQSRNHGVKMQLRSSECNASSQLPEAENFDGVGRLQHSQSSVSPGFGLQLGPPSQRSRFPDHPSSSQSIQGAFNSLDATEMGDKGHQMVASNSVQSLSSIEATEAKSKLNRSAILGNVIEKSPYRMPGNFTSAFSSGIPHSRINVQNQQMTSGQMSMNQNVGLFTGNVSQSAHRRSVETLSPDASRRFNQDNLASPGGMSQQNGLNDVQERVPTATIPTRDSERVTQHFAMPGLSGQGGSAELLHNVRTNVPTHQHNIGFQFQQPSSHIPELPQPNILESSFVPLAQGHVHSHGVVDGKEQGLKESSGQLVASVSTDAVPKTTKSLGKASSMKNCFDESSANSASTQKDIEAFGRSLKPNSFSHQNYFLQNQMQALKDAEMDSSNRVSKRMKGPDNIGDVHEAAVLKAGQQNEHNAVVGDSFGSGHGAPTEDSRMLSFSKPADILHRNASFQGNVASADTLGLRRDVPQSNSSSDYMTPVRADHHHVSPQMAPSWFNQYGTSKNGQLLHIYDAHKFSPLRLGESPFTLGKSSSGLDMNNAEDKGIAAPIDACNQNCTPSSVANEHFSSPQSSQPDVSQHLVISKPKKRKTATSELHPWHKEILDDSRDFQTLSMAEADWSKAANCLTQKVEDDVELTEDGPPILRSKRRLTLTTHLMQQLFRPAPASILSADASTGYEILAYAISRIELGDACSTVSRLSNFVVPCDGMDLPLSKGKSLGRNIGRRYAKATEELLGRARKLQNDFLRLDKSASILDLGVECQDLQKFSVINRFARFHGRGQTENAETAPTNVTSNTQKPMPQKYVTAVPMPRSLPDRVQCLSL